MIKLNLPQVFKSAEILITVWSLDDHSFTQSYIYQTEIMPE